MERLDVVYEEIVYTRGSQKVLSLAHLNERYRQMSISLFFSILTAFVSAQFLMISEFSLAVK